MFVTSQNGFSKGPRGKHFSLSKYIVYFLDTSVFLSVLFNCIPGDPFLRGSGELVLNLTATATNTINHSANFFLYVLSGQQFRQWFMEAISCRKHGRRQGQTPVRSLTPTRMTTNLSTVSEGPMGHSRTTIRSAEENITGDISTGNG